jgi:hypothetical protein
VVHLLPADADTAAKDHFTAEARSLARLNHSNVVATYDTGVDGDGTSYRVDELAGGEPLDLNAVDDAQRVSYATQIASALADAHDVGVVHGSLTSRDVLINDEGRVQVRGLCLPRDAHLIEQRKRDDVAAAVNLIAALAPSAPSPLRELALGWRKTTPPDVAMMRDDLLAVHDATTVPTTATIDLAQTTGVPARGKRGRQLSIVAAVVAVLAALVVAVVLPNRHNADLQGPAQTLALTATSFDPQARPATENEREAHLAVDGNATSAWSTERYKSAHFGHLKDGVGLVLHATGSGAEFDSITINSVTRGWTVVVYAAEQPAAALSGWGEPVARASVRGDTKIDLNGARGGALLIWISDPGTNLQVRINEIAVQGRV